MHLHPDMIEQVNQRVDIVEVISEHVVLRKSGANFRGPCPFHQGSNPTALSVNPNRQAYHCFNCGASGGAIKFLMEVGKQSFQDVVLELAQRHQIPIKAETAAQSQEFQRQRTLRQQLYELMALAANFYSHTLRSPQGASARAYLQKRNLHEETIAEFGLGFAPQGWETLLGYLTKQKGMPVELVEQAGLAVPRTHGGGYYDRFRDRLMIPIRDTQGRVVGFGGRTLGAEEPKYLNSPETELFRKRITLFALDRARSAIGTADRAIVVEGYFDAIALHQAGIREVVATMGTALTEEQLRQLLKYCESKQVFLNFDADRAGINGVGKAIANFQDLIYQGLVQLKVVTLPDGKDADDFLRHHRAADYETLLRDAPLYLDWQIAQILAGQDLAQASIFQRCSQAITELLGKLPADSFLRTHYIHHGAQQLARGNGHLSLRIEQDLRRQLRYSRWYGRKPSLDPLPSPSAQQLAETQLLQIFLHIPGQRTYVYEAIQSADLDFSLSHHRHLWQMILELIDGAPQLLQDEGEELVRSLQMACAEDGDLDRQLHHLLWLDENSRVALMRPAIVVRAAIAKIQYVLTEKRYRYWRDLWEKNDLSLNPQLGHYYQEKIQVERLRIVELQKQLEINYEHLIEKGGLILEF
jgi:DNA primase